MRRALLVLLLLGLPLVPWARPAAGEPVKERRERLERRERILAATEYLLGELERHEGTDSRGR